MNIRSIIHYILLGTLSLGFCIPFNLYGAEITVQLLNSNNKPASNIVVYLLPLDRQVQNSRTDESIKIFQSEMEFSPYISVSQKGKAATFINNDDITHHIYSASSENRFSFRIKHNEQNTIDNLKSGQTLMGCNIHDWMSGYLFIVDSSLYSKSNSEGKSFFNINPDGRYQLKYWHPYLGNKDANYAKEITIKDNEIYSIVLHQELTDSPTQESTENLDFIKDY